MKEQQFLLNGLHCAACVHRVEKMVGRLPNAALVSVNLADQTAFVQGDVEPEQVIATIQRLGFGAELLESERCRREKQQAQMQSELRQKKATFVLALTVGTLLMFYGMWGGMHLTPENHWHWWLWTVVTLTTMVVSGRHFFTGAWVSLKNGTANMDTLIAISTGVAFLYSFYLTAFSEYGRHLYFEASVMIIGFINLGKFLELKAKQRSSLALEKLLDLAPPQAVIWQDGVTKTVPVKAIKPQMLLQVCTGDRLAVDGVMQSGTIWVDESMLTGEALPIEKKIGDKVRAGTLVQDGAGVFIAEQVGEKTALARIIHSVRIAQSSKPLLAKWVDKIAAIFVPIVVCIALLSGLIWLALGKPWDFVISVFTTVLIIACPCALGLAIPLSTIAGVARSAEFGVLLRNIDAIQAASQIDTLVFDKTGTLTTGEMQVSEVQTFHHFDQTTLLRMVKSIEQHASHPIAKALVRYCQALPDYEISALQVVKGQGIVAQIDGQEVRVGNAKFVKSMENLTRCHQLGTQVFIAVNGKTVGVIYLQDQLRPESQVFIQQWQQQGYQCLMLTGDRQTTAQFYAEQLGLDGVIADVLPEQKAVQIARLQTQGRKVAMIGDGINDAPALAQANVGIAMHNGSEIAMETADLSLMCSGLQPLAEILPFSKRVLRNMKQSLIGAFIYNVISIPIAAGVLYPFTGWLLNPMISAIAMALSSVTVVLNSQRLLR